MSMKYRVGQHDGGWAYEFDGTWSESFDTHEKALVAARQAAARQRVGGRDAVITYETPDGKWHTEIAEGGDRPETIVVGTVH